MYSVLIVGAGNQGAFSDVLDNENFKKIISFAHAFKEHPEFNLLGFYDIDIEKAKKAAIIWKTNYWSEWLVDADVIIIATSDKNHFEPLKKALNHKPKLVIVEKPITTDLEQAREIVELYKQKNIPLMVNYTRRFLPYYQNLKDKYDNGELGYFLYGKIIFNRGLFHTGTHAIDFLNWFFGDYRLVEDRIDIKHLKNFEGYRIWNMDLYFENKYRWIEERINDMNVWDYYDKSHWYVVDNAYKFLQGKEELKCTDEDGLKALEIAFELKEG